MTFIKVIEYWGTAQVLDIRYYDYMIISLGALSCSSLLSGFMATTSLEAMCHHSSATMFCPTMGLDAMKPAWVESSETRSLGKASPLCVGQHVTTGKG